MLWINTNIIFRRKINWNKQWRKLPNLLPFLGIAMKEPRLPPITLCGLRKGGFLKDPVYWWRNECMLWDVGGLPFFTIGSTVQKHQNIHRHKQGGLSGTCQKKKKERRKRVSKQDITSLVKLSFMLTADHHTMAISLLTNKLKTWH